MIILIPLSSTSQRTRKKGKTIKAITGIQTSYDQTEYSFTPFDWTSDSEDITLTYLTPRSGTFEIEEGEKYYYTYEGKFIPTSISIGMGFGIKIINAKNNWHEISLTKLSFSKTTTKAQIQIFDDKGEVNSVFTGVTDNSFSIGLRYQVGRYLGDPSLVTRFGIAVVLDPVYHQFKRVYYTTNIFPVNSKVINLHLGISPMLNFKISNRVSLTTKLIPQVRIASIEKVRELNPSVPLRNQLGSIKSNFNYFSMSGAITLEYVMKEPKRRRR